MDPLDLELAVAEGRAMLAAFRRERGLDDAEEVDLADAIVSLLHAVHATGKDAREIARDVMSGVADFWTDAGRV